MPKYRMRFTEWLDREYRVVTETTPEDASVLLTQGVEPSFKRKIPVDEYQPGRGIDRDNLYVMYPNATTKGSFGRIRLHLKLNQSQLDVSQEMKQFGHTDIEHALTSSDGAVTQGRIPKEAFFQVEVYSDGNWKVMLPVEFLQSIRVGVTPALPTVDQYQQELEKHAEEWFLSPRKVQDMIMQYNRASLQDKIELAREVGLVPAPARP